MSAAAVPRILGITGTVRDATFVPRSAAAPAPRPAAQRTPDVDLKRMAEWSLHYLINTLRPHLGYEPVFQCHPLKCPPVPDGHDVVVPCDTDARMEWEWYYMREISGSDAGRDVERAFHRRMRAYVERDGTVLAPPGCYNEADIHARFERSDYVYHVWGATKILHSLALEYLLSGDADTKATARAVMERLRGLARWETRDGIEACWLPGGMTAVKPDGSLLDSGWRKHPAPVVEPLLTYYRATGDQDGLAFARAYAEGIVRGLQPGGIRFKADGRFDEPLGHSHATMHALWGVNHLGVLTGERRYVDFARRAWDWMLSRGTGTGWFPAMPDSCNETCCVSDMISHAALFGHAGDAEHFDYVERYLRNYIDTLQFVITPEFEDYYREINAGKEPAAIDAGLRQLRKFQGGIVGGSGLNDYENDLLGNVSGFEMFGCCAPEGMRAIHTAWAHTIEQRHGSPWGPDGIYVNMSFSRESPWGDVCSFFPDRGRITVKPKVDDVFYLRPPHWAPRERVSAFTGTRPIPPRWSGDYVRFDARAGVEITITYPLVRFHHQVRGLWPDTAPDLSMSFEWLGNMVTGASPPPEKTALFTGTPRVLPAPPLPP